MMYRIVQTTSDPRIPIGISRCGFFASCAAVDTASKPIYAKKIDAAPAAMPLNPKLPASSLGGMNGCQFIVPSPGCCIKVVDSQHQEDEDASFTITIAVLKFADS